MEGNARQHRMRSLRGDCDRADAGAVGIANELAGSQNQRDGLVFLRQPAPRLGRLSRARKRASENCQTIYGRGGAPLKTPVQMTEKNWLAGESACPTKTQALARRLHHFGWASWPMSAPFRSRLGYIFPGRRPSTHTVGTGGI